jgi:hypothetical protein
MRPDLATAATFVRILTGSSLTPMSWQVFDDSPTRRDGSMAAIHHGPLASVSYQLGRANDSGCGVFVTVNETDLRGRRAANIRSVRALYIDTDGFVPKSFHLPPTMVVRSFAGVHAYWRVSDAMPLADFRNHQKRLIQHYQSDPKIHNLDRVMRVPGFWHQKGEPFAVDIVDADGRLYHSADVVAGLAPLPTPAPKRQVRSSLAGIDWSGLDVIDIFGQAGFSPRDLGGGKWAIICPWTGEHSHPDWDGKSTSTVVWERSAGSPATFHCSHAHCEGRRLSDALSAIGYRPSPADVVKSRIAAGRALYERTLAEQGGNR